MSEENRKAAWWADIKRRATKTLIKSQMLLADVDRNYKRILEFEKRYSDEKIAMMDWEEKEKVYAEAEVLFKKMEEYQAISDETDAEYQAIRAEVNEYYGREVMRDIPSYEALSALFPVEENDDAEGEPDSADWWKKE